VVVCFSLLQANNNESLQIVCSYHSLAIPPHGGEIVFHPLEHLQPVKYCRPKLSQLGLGDLSSTNEQHYLADKNEVVLLLWRLLLFNSLNFLVITCFLFFFSFLRQG
jgi:hypothetical protein